MASSKSVARPIQSMTGSGTATGSCELGRVTVEARAVNGRGASVRFRLAPDCGGLESWIEARVKERIVRGNVTIAADIVDPKRAVESAIDEEAFRTGTARLRELATSTGLAAEPTIGDVLGLPGVVRRLSSDRAHTSWEPSEELAALFASAIDRLVERRVEEGASTVAALRQHASALRAELDAIALRTPELVKNHREAILERVRDFLAEHGVQLEPADVVREVAVFADRADVTEEVERLRAHADRLEADLGGAGPIGREVEFLLQEMLREANTLGSKSPDVEVAHRVVAMKSHVERLKEHAANLE